jgi:hypothetical protein
MWRCTRITLFLGLTYMYMHAWDKHASLIGDGLRMDEMTDEATRSPVRGPRQHWTLTWRVHSGLVEVVGQPYSMGAARTSAYMHACTQAGRTRYDREACACSSRVCVTCMVETQTRAADRRNKNALLHAVKGKEWVALACPKELSFWSRTVQVAGVNLMYSKLVN